MNKTNDYEILPCLRDIFEDETTAVLFHDPNLNKTS